MQGEQHPQRLLLRNERQAVLDRLSDAFAADQLGLEEYEQRVDSAYQGSSVEALRKLVADLEPTGTGLVAPSRSVELAVHELSAVPAKPRHAMAIFGNLERKGKWSVPTGTRVLAVFGNVELDLRDAVFAPGITELHARAVFGNIELTVPPELIVECEGSGVLGSFASMHRVPPEGSENTPRLRVLGAAVFGNVEIRTLPRAQHPAALPPKTAR